MRKNSLRSMQVYLIALTLKSFVYFFINYYKVIIISNFIFIILAYYFYALWLIETSRASFNSLYSNLDIEVFKWFPIKGVMKLKDEKTIAFNLTNLDEDSSFILLNKDDAAVLKNLSRERFQLEIEYENISFMASGRIVCFYDTGIGLVFEIDPYFQSHQVGFDSSWNTLYQVCSSRMIYN